MLRSLDVQQIILQSNSVERVHQVQQQHPDLQQKYFADQLNKEKSLLKEKVKDLEESERLLIKEEDGESRRERNSKGGKQEKKKEDTSGVSNDMPADGVGIRVDIKV
jgi:hypothetical protein